MRYGSEGKELDQHISVREDEGRDILVKLASKHPSASSSGLGFLAKDPKKTHTHFSYP